MAPYKCGACLVQGVGDECWYCGSRSIQRTGLSYLKGYHHHDPTATSGYIGPQRIEYEEIDRVLQG